MDSEDKETEAIISLSGDLLSKPEGVWGCLFPIRNPLPESFREVLRAASAFTMKRLNWCTKANEHAYMKLRQKQNWEVAKSSKAECWMRDLLRESGLKFARQTQWGMRLFDFYNLKLGIAIEVDGPEHRPDYDAYRDEYNFRRSGIVVLRVPNFDRARAEDVIRFIRNEQTLKERKRILGIDGHTKEARRILVHKPYPPSLLAEYLNNRCDVLAEEMKVLAKAKGER